MSDDEIDRICPLLTDRVAMLERDMEKVKSAFPNHDYEGHMRGHAALIRQTEAKERLAMAIKEKTISGLIWLALVALGTLLWQGVKVKIQHLFGV